MTTEYLPAKLFPSRRAAEREALRLEQNSRENFYFACTDPDGKHYIMVYNGPTMMRLDNVIDAHA